MDLQKKFTKQIFMKYQLTTFAFVFRTGTSSDSWGNIILITTQITAEIPVYLTSYN